MLYVSLGRPTSHVAHRPDFDEVGLLFCSGIQTKVRCRMSFKISAFRLEVFLTWRIHRNPIE